MRDILEVAARGDTKAKTALEVFIYRVIKYIGVYDAAVNGVDAVIFTAGIGENCPSVRSKILTNFTYLGLNIDEQKNQANAAIFSPQDSEVYAMTIATNEELVIAIETNSLVSGVRIGIEST